MHVSALLEWKMHRAWQSWWDEAFKFKGVHLVLGLSSVQFGYKEDCEYIVQLLCLLPIYTLHN